MTTVAVSKLEESIVEYLKGSLGMVTALELQFELLPGAEDRTCRAIRAAIKRLNDRGFPIISTRRGFRLARYSYEIQEYKRELVQRANKILDRVAALEYAELSA